jgi:hypothetical protein
MSTELLAIIAGLLTSFGVDAIPDEFIEFLTNQISPALLGNNRLQRNAARAAVGLLGLGEKQHEDVIEAVIMDFFEGVAERSKKLTGEKDKDQELVDAVIRKLKGENNEDEEEEDDMAKPKTKTTPATAPVPAKPPEQTLLQVVGGLEAAKQTEFWTAANAITAGMTPEDKTDFEGRISRITLAKEEVLALLSNPDVAARTTLLQQTVMNAHNAGGVSGGFRSIMDSASNALRSATSGINQSSPGELRKKLETVNKRRKRDDDDVGGIR